MTPLEGQSTLSLDEKISEARVHLAALLPLAEEMNERDKNFVLRLATYFQMGARPSNLQTSELFWLRDLRLRY
jgi:hypothetical protein